MDTPFIIIPTRNEEKNLPNVLSDIENQSMKAEVIVVDGLSEDRTVEIAKEYGATVISMKSTVGWARHTGTVNANSEHILQTDADARLPDTWVEKHHKYLDNYYLVTGPIMYKDDNIYRVFNPWALFGQHVLMNLKVSCVAANMSFQKSKYVGFRDMNYAEDMDFMLRMIETWGADCHVHDNALAVQNNHYPADWWAREFGWTNR